MSIDTKCSQYKNCDDERNIVRALSKGTCGMRGAGQFLLPKEPAEEEEDYKARLARSFLFNAYGNAKSSMIGKIYANPVQLEGTHPLLEGLLEDADLAGQDLTGFMRAVQDDSLDHGVSYILVDNPMSDPNLSKEQEDRLKIRPYFVHVKRDNLIGWDFERVGGVDVLKEIRIEERFYEKKNPEIEGVKRTNWEEIELHQVRVIRPDDYEIWREDETGAFHLIEEGVWTLGKIPLVPVPTNMVARFVGEPSFRDLAFLNVQHWQSMSDQKNILHVARVPILFGKQLGDNKPSSIGAGVSVFADAEESDLKYVELQGHSIQAGREDLKDTEDRMSILALEPQVSRTGNVTATSKAIDQAKANTQIEAWSLAAEDALTTAIQYAFEWIGQEAEFSVVMDRDFSIGVEQSEDAKLLLSMYQTGALTIEQLYAELKRRNILDAGFDIDIESAQIEETLIGIETPISRSNPDNL